MQILKKITMLAFLMSAFAVGAAAQLTGTKNIPGDYATVAAAVTDLNTNGVGAGGVTFVVNNSYTETAPAGGYSINSPTGNGAGNPIVFRRAVSSGARPTFTASAALTAGALNDAIFKIIGTDNVTIDGFAMSENAANTTTAAATNNMTEFGVALFYATTTNGSQNVTVQNCIIDLDRTYQNTFGVYSNSTASATSVTTAATATTTDGGNSGLKLYSNSITDVNIGIVVVGPTAAADNNEGLDIGGTAAATGNSITNYGTTGTFSGFVNVSGSVNGILVRNTRNFNVSYNSVVSSNGGTTAGTLRGIYVPGFSNTPTGTITNSINNNNISLKSGLATGIMQGIVNESGTVSAATTTLNVNNNDFRDTTHTTATASGAITFISQAATSLNTNINANTFTNMTVNTTGSVTFISNSVTRPAGAVTNANNNQVIAQFSKTGGGGTVFFYDSFGSTTSGSETNTGNNFSNMTFTGATTISGFRSADGGTPFPSKTVTNNNFTNIVGGTNGMTILTVGFSSATTANNVSGNVISNISGGGAVLGLTSSAGTQNFFANTINSLSSTGASAVTGISITGGATQAVYRNKIYDLSGSNAGSFVSGILVSTAATTSTDVYNNLIGDLRATAATSAATPAATDAIRGINITATNATTTINVSFNTVYLNATSTGANFSSSALFATTSATATTATLNSRNNILVNLSTPTGTGIAAAYRRSSSDLTNYGSVSNNNDYFAGTPSATRLIFYDGTNSDQTLGAFKARVTPRDSNSVSENPNFLSTTGSNAGFLHINDATPTQLESGGIPVSGITNDYDAQPRSATTPDIGADEFFGTPIDLSAPTISYTPLVSTTATTNRTITVTITDASGIAGGANSPRIYFRKNGGAYVSTQCTGTAPTYTCTIDYTLLGGVAVNDVIDYFVVAQDNNGNVGANPSGGFAATSVNNVTSPPTTPNTYTITAGFPASVNVGTGETYTGLTTTGGVFAALNSGVLTGNVTVNITSDLTAETGAVALNQLNEEGANPGTYTVTIKPTGAARAISGTNATGAIIRLVGADRVTIDGSLSGGTDRSLTITNLSTATGTAAIHIASAGVNAGATNDTVKNTNLSCGADQSTTVNVTYGISQGGTLLGSGGADNDNNSFVNNAITKVNVGIFSSGENATNPVQNTVISNNLIGPAAFGADQIGRAGIIFNQTNAAQVVGNEVRFVGVTEPQTSSGGSYDKFGISHAFNGWSETTVGDLAVSNTVIARNRVHDIVEENTFSAVGIFMAGGNGTNDTLNQTVNNFIYNVRANGTSGDNSVSLGIASGKGDTVAFNSIYMAGDLDPGLATAAATASYGIQIPNTTVQNLNLKNNIAYVDLTSSSTTTLINSVIRLPAAFSFGTGGSNYNDLYFPATNTQMVLGRIGTTAAPTDYPTLAAYQAAVAPQEANSKSVDPLFVSATDLHLQTTSPVRASATPIAGITTDIDGDTRNPNTPDIGADEAVAFAFPTVQFSGAAYTGAEGTTVTITVNRTGDTTVAGTVNYATSNGTATGGAACGAGVDYQSASGTLSFAAGETSKTFTVTICADANVKGDETVNLTLSAPNGATLGTPATAVLTITNVNPATPGVLALSSATYTVGEAGGTTTITVNRTGGSDGAVSATYALSGGTATGGATCAAGVDYVNTGGTVSFANGETTKTFTVQICNDTAVEGNETFNVTLSNATGGATVGTPSTAVVTITDDDVAQNGAVQFSQATYTVTEAGPTATITITRTGGSDGSITVNYATVAGGTATGAAACAAGVDYVNTSGTATFGAGVTTQTFTIPICNDTVSESSETVNLALTNATGGATLGTPNTAVLTITDDDVLTGPVTVTATGGTATASYNNLTEAAAAINAGTQTGAIVVSINQTITEPGTVVINGSGAGAASYTSLLIRPTADNLSASGATVQGRGLIELNGADNVTIDGDNPNSTGTNRNLTLSNTAASAVTFTSVIRVAIAATGTTSADGNAFRNLNILGNATGRNVPTATSITSAENSTFGIFAGPGASTTDPTAPPAVVTSVSTSVAAGATAANLIVNNNAIGTVGRGVSMNGAATSVFPGLQITGNRIGNPTAGDADQVYSIGVTAQGSLDGVISNNLVWIEGYLSSSATTQGINVGVNSATGTFTIERNMVNRVQNNNGATWSAYGINLGGGTNHVVQNNFVSGIINSQTAGTGGFGLTFGAYGIRIGGGTGHKIYHNSVNLYGAVPGATSTNLTSAFLIAATTQTGLDVRNNIFSNQITGGNPTGTRNAAITLPSGGTAAMNLTLNNNAYYVGTDANNRLAQVGATFGTGEYQATAFDPTATTPATNFRAYTSTLSAAGTNDNASFASLGQAPFVSNVNLHIPAGTATRLESGGAAVGVTTDIDLETRSATTPDIGADEFAGQPAPANDMAAVAFVTPANGATVPTGVPFTPQASFLNNGTATQTNVTVRYRITNSSNTVIYNQTATIASIAPLQIVTVSFPATTLTAAGTYTIQASVELAGDSNPANDSITGTINAVNPISGAVNVGAGETYTSLTNPGGIFQALNTAGISGNIVINITSDLTAETGAIPLNQLSETGAGNYTVTIKPTGAARVISGTAAATSLIKLNGADRVTIDGSLSNGTDRSLSLLYTNAGGTVVWIASASATNGANNNTVKNCIIASNPGTSSVAGILAGSGTTLGAAAESPNSNNTVQNNQIFRVQNSMFIFGGATAATLDQNWVITNNELSSATAADKNSFRGMLLGNAQNFTVTGNSVLGVRSTATTTVAMSGIQIAGLLNGGLVAKNKVTDIKNVSTTGTGAFGMQISATSANSNVTIANNFISDVAANGSATITSNGFGMSFNGSGTGYNVFYNSVNLTTDQATAQTSAALFVATTFATAGALDVRNNNFVNTQTTGNRYAVYSAAAATVFTTINYNDYFAQNVGFIGGAPRPTLADWQAATGQDANSKAVDPLFVSATDLHLQATSPVLDSGTPIASVTDDIDGQTRSTTAPDIGADEVTAVQQNGTLALSAAAYSVNESAGTVTVTVNRTGGTDGAVSAAYTLGGGTATGGASCAAGVDYVNTGGTVNFAAGQSSQTFTVTICNDALVESNETFTVTLATPTGGATIGTPATATVTINDDDTPALPTLSINDVRVVEGDAGTVNAVFTVTLSAASATPVTVNYATANGTATAGSDYVAASGTLTFAPGQTTQTITVTVNGDTLREAFETFFVNLSNATGATIADAQGIGIIADDDQAVNADFDNDGRTDFSVFRPSNGFWYVLQSGNNLFNPNLFGVNGDLPVPGDYDGDGATDYAVFRPSNGFWYIQRSSDFTFVSTQWGFGTDKPVQGDYDGDGRTDIAVWRPSNGTWYIIQSGANNQFTSVRFGAGTDIPVQGDYDGDGKTDVAVYRSGVWYVFRSATGTVSGFTYGAATDKPLVGDFDGDGRDDYTVYRSGVWFIFQSGSQTSRGVAFGAATDIPVVGDYDGDLISDIAVFRPSIGSWFILQSSNGAFNSALFGQQGDIPIPAGYQSLQ